MADASDGATRRFATTPTMGLAAKDDSRRENDARVSLALRALQLAVSASALALLAAGFPRQTLVLATADGATSLAVATYLGGPTVSFLLLVTCGAALFALFWLALVHAARVVTLPLDAALLIDALLAVLLVSGASAFLASDYVGHCELLGERVRCGAVKTAGALALVAFLLFLCSVAWGAYLRLQVKKDRALRGAMPSAILPYEGDDDADHHAEAVDYIPTTPHHPV